jgi:CTD small phosphatase-like protein 2
MLVNLKKSKDNINLIFSKENEKSNDNNLEISENSTLDSEDTIINFDEKEKENKLIPFEEIFHQYYVDSSQNRNGNFDAYIKSGLKLISLLPKENYINQIEKISSTFKLKDNVNQNKKTLILDLDETLIHSDLDLIYKDHETTLYFDSEDDEILGKNVPIPLILRPNLFDFLNYVYDKFELIIFTASHKNYADKIIDYIEKDKRYFSLRLYRQHCIFIKPGIYIKDLRIFKNRDLKNIILIDNSIFSFSNQLSNGILITSFYHDKEDDFLLSLKDYLEYLIEDCDDVRTINKEQFKFEIYQNDLINNLWE